MFIRGSIALALLGALVSAAPAPLVRGPQIAGSCISFTSSIASSTLISRYDAGMAYSKADAKSCITNLQTAAATSCTLKQKTTNVGKCYCMFKFGSDIDTIQTTTQGDWFQTMSAAVDDSRFLGVYTAEHLPRETISVGGVVDCRGNADGINNMLSRWSQGLTAAGYIDDYQVWFTSYGV